MAVWSSARLVLLFNYSAVSFISAPGYNYSSTSTFTFHPFHQLTYSFAHYNICVKDGNTSTSFFASLVVMMTQCQGIIGNVEVSKVSVVAS